MNNYSCDSCDSCDYCYSCIRCVFCYYCENLVNGFMCVNLKLNEKDDKRYWIFNKEVTKEEWGNRHKLGYSEKKKVPETIEYEGHKYKLVEEDE